ncbi:MAG: hypothetical protein ACOX60_06205 [Massiliimalia sp.]
MTKEQVNLANELLQQEEKTKIALADLEYFSKTKILSVYGGDEWYTGEPVNLNGILTEEEIELVYHLLRSLVSSHQREAREIREAL